MQSMGRRAAVAVVWMLICGAARAAVPILPLDQVKPGMKGVGKTVFQGTVIEDFDVTVIGVMKSFDFQMDMILIRIESGPVVTRKYGVVAGMSGSPIFIDGKMIGALAYGWDFQVEPIAGVTPIEQMLEHYDPQHPLVRAARDRRAAQPASPLDLRGALRSSAPVTLGGRAVSEVHVAPNGDEAAALQRARPDLAVLHPLATPLYVSGLGASSVRLLSEILEPYNLRPMQAGSAGSAPDMPFELAPGAAVGVPVASGDIELSAVGTLTYVDGDTLLAFGHPFFGFGGVELPFCSAHITTVISSLADSNKMGGLIAPIGTLVQDRPTCVGAKLGPAPGMIPVEYRLTESDRQNERTFRVRMARQPQLANLFAVSLMNGAMENVAGSDYDGVIDSRIEITARASADAEPQTIVRSNSFSAQGQTAFGTNPLYDLFQALALLTENPFGKPVIEGVKVDVSFTRERKMAMLQRAQASRLKVKPGETVEVVCELKPFGEEKQTVKVPVEIPANAPLGPLAVILIGGGDSYALRPRINPTPTPTDVASLLRWLNSDGRSEAIFCELMLASNGLEFGGRRLPDLPEPIAEALLTTSGEALQPVRDVAEQVYPTEQAVSGVGVVLLEVVGPEGEKAEGAEEFRSPGFEPPQQNLLSPSVQLEMPSGPSASRLAACPALERVATRGMASIAARTERSLERIAWASAPVERFRAAAWERLRRGTPMPADAFVTRDAGAPTAADGGAAAPAAEGEAPAEGPPDLTDELELDKPPAMPTWRELRAVEKGDLGVGEPAAAGTTAAQGSEDSEDEPLARPASTWTLADAKSFLDGRFENTYLSDDGRVAMAPLLTVFGRPEVDRAWAVLPRPDGSVLVSGWGEQATVHQIAADGAVSELLSVDDAGVSALCLVGEQVFAAAAPSGRIYRLAADGNVVVADLDEPYIWALVPDGAGGVWAATGNRGRLYRVSAAGEATVVFQARDRHLTALCAAPDGGVYTGACPSGRVYRVDDTGARSVFQAEDAGVLSLASTAEHLYVGTAGTGQVYRVARDGSSEELLKSDDNQTGNIYALVADGATVYAAAGQPGRILRFDGEQVKAQLYTTDEPLILGLGVSNARLFGSVAVSGDVVSLALEGGERGTYVSPVYDAKVAARWGTVRWLTETTGQAVVTIETRTGNSSTPDAAWSDWSPALVERGGQQVTSPAARYIQLRASFYGSPGERCELDRVSLFYRTINRAPTITLKKPADGDLAHGELELEWEAEDPDEDKLTYRAFYAPVGSEDWQPIRAATEEEEKPAETPAGETTTEPGDGQPAEGDTGDAPAAPEQPGDATPAAHGALAGWWSELRAAASRWFGRSSAPAMRPVSAEAPTAPDEPPAGGDESADEGAEEVDKPLTETSLKWDTTEVPDGVYRIKVVASDLRRNPDDPRETPVLSGLLRIDNTAPTAVTAPTEEPVPPPAELIFEDAGSWLASAEYQLDDGEWTALLPVDGIFDSPRETIKLPAIDFEGGPVKLTVRLRDAAGNVAKLTWNLDAGAAVPVG